MAVNVSEGGKQKLCDERMVVNCVTSARTMCGERYISRPYEGGGGGGLLGDDEVMLENSHYCRKPQAQWRRRAHSRRGDSRWTACGGHR